MQEKAEIITNHIVDFWTILDKNTQKWILCIALMGVVDTFGPCLVPVVIEWPLSGRELYPRSCHVDLFGRSIKNQDWKLLFQSHTLLSVNFCSKLILN